MGESSENGDSDGVADSARPGQKDEAQKAGRGGLAIAVAKLYFIVVGLGQQIALPIIIGAGGYGALSRVLGLASIAYNPIVQTSIQGVSRAVAQTPDDEQPATIRRTLLIHAVLAVVAGAGFFFLAPSVASWTAAPHAVVGLRIISGVLFFYGLYAPLVGVMNGKKRFVAQAAFDMAFATIRTVGLVLGGYWLAKSRGLGPEGALGGFVLAAGLIAMAAGAFIGIGRRGAGGPSIKEHLAFVAPLLIGQVLLNMLLQADLQLVGRFASDAAAASGLDRSEGDVLVGAYRATQLFCFLPYQLLMPVILVLFPMLATALRDGDPETVAKYVRTGVRLALVLAGLMVSVTSGLSGPLLGLVFGKTPEYAELATRSMQVLTIGFGAFAIFGVLTAVLNSLKRERAAMLATAVAVGLVVATAVSIVPGTEFGPSILERTALSTSVGLAAATVATVVLVYRTAGTVVSPLSAARVIGAMAATIVIARQLPVGGKMATIGFSAVVGAIYVVLLLVTGELGRADLESVKAIVARRRSPR